jgi:hypothetical protein
MHHEMSTEMQRCIELCQQCHASCLTTVSHCLDMGGEHASRSHITILLDCAAACAQSADFMLRGSDMHGRVCGVCAEACERCAEDCERLANGEQHMLHCAAICRQCAESCRMMATMTA